MEWYGAALTNLKREGRGIRRMLAQINVDQQRVGVGARGRLLGDGLRALEQRRELGEAPARDAAHVVPRALVVGRLGNVREGERDLGLDRKSTRLNSSH